MAIDLKQNAKIFIEESVFVMPGFHAVLRDIVALSEKNSLGITFLLDPGVREKVKEYKEMAKLHEAYLLDGLVDILEMKGVVSFVATNSYLDFTALEGMVGQKGSYCVFITQREQTYKAFRGMPHEEGTITFMRYGEGMLFEWVAQKEAPTKAFYLATDEYVNRFDTDAIDYVYSPKYGYLALDVSSRKNGGEGSVYRTYNNMMVKIFKSESITYVNFKKLMDMISMRLYNPFICWPRDVVYYDNCFVGYVMDEVKDAETLLSLRLQSFKQYSHLDRLEI